jgi:hypothetical protein
VSTPERPSSFRPVYDSTTSEIYRRFQAVENPIDSGLYWLDTRSGDLWRLVSETKEWRYLGSPRGANNGPNGTYQALADPKGGVYILNTGKGDGWWTDGNVWKIIGDLSRQLKAD